MKRYLFIMLAVVAIVVAIVLFIKNVTPLNYADKPLRTEALEYLNEKQKISTLTSEQAAQTYLFFQTPYQDAAPTSLKMKVVGKIDGSARVMLHQPEVQEENVTAKVDRIYLRRDSEGRWIPFKHEWAFKGRGKFGWTTTNPMIR